MVDLLSIQICTGNLVPIGAVSLAIQSASRAVEEAETSPASVDECAGVRCLHVVQWTRDPPKNVALLDVEDRSIEGSPWLESENESSSVDSGAMRRGIDEVPMRYRRILLAADHARALGEH